MKILTKKEFYTLPKEARQNNIFYKKNNAVFLQLQKFFKKYKIDTKKFENEQGYYIVFENDREIYENDRKKIGELEAAEQRAFWKGKKEFAFAASDKGNLTIFNKTTKQTFDLANGYGDINMRLFSGLLEFAELPKTAKFVEHLNGSFNVLNYDCFSTKEDFKNSDNIAFELDGKYDVFLDNGEFGNFANFYFIKKGGKNE